MAQHGFRNFGSLTFLQGIDKPKFLTPLLKRHVRYFKRHGVCARDHGRLGGSPNGDGWRWMDEHGDLAN